MAPRLLLHQLLETLVDHVYFQPPATISIQYPCIIYRRDFADSKYADNLPYKYLQRYQVMVIDTDPDSVIVPKVANLPTSVFNRYYATEGLNHDVFNVYF
jgi:hypothetical protein